MYAHTCYHNPLGMYDPSGQHPDITTLAKTQGRVEGGIKVFAALGKSISHLDIVLDFGFNLSTTDLRFVK